MNASNILLDKYCKACSIAQDKDLAVKLRVTKSAVSNWRNGRAHPDAKSVARMCEATGEQVAHWLPLIEAERARTPEDKKVWLRLAQMAAAITLAVGLYPAHAETITARADVSNSATSIHYAQLRTSGQMPAYHS
ncbi:helix-turn-helix domain-containing protein [Dyella jiangningensis]|uniref:HTH cro/C1-type domain-containing protein n=1 Tax=Dyella jiangningensis TaxID=1379159 RepID=A0A328PDS2_9GAMM|nr:helix-turn-helix transcriptional regulator [Dyella jiangningensis]RAO78195.1 hypothetical protein CA260_10340 [Dyella jiangningensis]